MTWLRSLLFISLALVAQLATAQNTPVRVRAISTGFDGQVLAVKTREGEAIQIHLPDNASVSAAKTITLADLKPGDFVGGATVKNAQGVMVARELHLFPAALRGVVSEGHMDWGLEPGSKMTNTILSAATVNCKEGDMHKALAHTGHHLVAAHRRVDGLRLGLPRPSP